MPHALVTNSIHAASDSSFYHVGGTIPADAPSYVSRRADNQLLAALRQGEYCYVLDSRQVGKSTLLVHTADSLRADGVRVAKLDVSSYGRTLTPTQWYFTLLEDIGDDLGIADELTDFWQQQHFEMAPLQRWLQTLEQVALPDQDSPLVILIDEIDTILKMSFPADELLAAIRACYNRRAELPTLKRLTFCLAGSATPDSLIPDPQITPFNIGTRIELTDFTEGEASPLAEGLNGKGDGKELLKRILYWTSGHPYLTQALCLAATKDNTDRLTPADIDRLCENLFLAQTPIYPEYREHLAHIRERLLSTKEDLAALLDLYGMVRSGRHQIAYESKNPLHTALRLSGLVSVHKGCLRVRNLIYLQVFDRRWIHDKMPDAELRQRAAVTRKAVARVIIVASIIILFFIGLTYKAVSEVKRADENAKQSQIKEQEAIASAEKARAALTAAQEARISAQQDRSALAVTQFKGDLEQAIRERRVDPQYSVLHFAILMNTVRISEPGDQLMRDIYQNMLTSYFVGTEGGDTKATSDYVSFFPFQNEIWQEVQHLPAPFTRALADQMMTDMPRQINDKETRGGHNIEKAVLDSLAVIASTENGKLLPSTVLIVLSDSEASSPPDGEADYRQEHRRTEFNTKLKGYHLSQTKAEPITKNLSTPGGKAYTASLYYRIYLPDTLTPLGRLSETRHKINSVQSPKGVSLTSSPILPSEAPSSKEIPFSDMIMLTEISIVILLFGLGYIVWVNRPRVVVINGMTIAVSRTKPLYLGGEEAGKSVMAVPGLPKGEKVAQLIVNGQGQVILKDVDMYKVGRTRSTAPVVIGSTEKKITVREKRVDGASYEVRARIV